MSGNTYPDYVVELANKALKTYRKMERYIAQGGNKDALEQRWGEEVVQQVSAACAPGDNESYAQALYAVQQIVAQRLQESQE